MEVVIAIETRERGVEVWKIILQMNLRRKKDNDLDCLDSLVYSN